MSKINKAKYRAVQWKKSRRQCLDINMKGFLCSCNNREKQCISEAYNILNKYNDLFNKETQAQKDLTKEGTDIQDDLASELSDLRSEKESKTFQVVESGAKNLLFIKTTLNNTVELATTILSDIMSTKKQQTKFLIRLVPIEITCKAYIKDIENSFKELALKYFDKEAKTFSVAYNHRNNNNLDRSELINCIVRVVNEVGSDNKVDLKSPQVVVVVEVIKGIALLSIIPNYFQYKKFNLLAFSGDQLPEERTNTDVPICDSEDN